MVKIGDQSFGQNRERRWFIVVDVEFEKNGECNFTNSENLEITYSFEIEDHAEIIYSDLLTYKNYSVPFNCGKLEDSDRIIEENIEEIQIINC